MSRRRPRADYYPQRMHAAPPNLVGGLVAGLVCGAAVLAISHYLPRVPVMVPLVIVTLVGLPPVFRGTLRSGVAVDDDGLTEHYPLGWRRRLPWSQVTELGQSPDSATLLAGTRRLTLDAGLCDWRALAERCREQLEPGAGPAPEAASVAPDEVAEWLGLSPGEEFVSRVPARAAVVGSLWLVALVVGLAWPAVHGGHPYWGPLLTIAILSWRPGRWRRSVREARADAQGLRFRVPSGWRDVGWDDLLEVRDNSEPRVVQTRRGEFWLTSDLPGRDRLLAAMRRAIEAREHGAALPRLAASAPDAALSRVTDTPPDAERGLSEVP